MDAQQGLRSLTWSGIQGEQKIREANPEGEGSILGNDPTKLLDALALHRSSLTELRIAHMDFANIDSLAALAQCSNLETMIFEYCSNIKAQAIRPMMDQAFANLKKVELIACENFLEMEMFARIRGVLQGNREREEDYSVIWG
jgi:hypothetical protein